MLLFGFGCKLLEIKKFIQIPSFLVYKIQNAHDLIHMYKMLC